jgi:hypothetical protein
MSLYVKKRHRKGIHSINVEKFGKAATIGCVDGLFVNNKGPNE